MLEKVPGATVLRTEAGGPYATAYHAHIKTSAGAKRVVLVNASFEATAVQAEAAHGADRAVAAAPAPVRPRRPATRRRRSRPPSSPSTRAKIVRAESNGDSSAPYESHITTSDGKELEVLVSKDLEVVDDREHPARPWRPDDPPARAGTRRRAPAALGGARSGHDARVTAASDHVDVLIVGAGISGIGAAWHLQHEQPGKSYAILEARDDLGGTWDLFRYPGIRSDSDLHTFAYAFKPWTDDEAIAGGEAILAYVRETAEENGIDRHIRFGHRTVRAEWSAEDARWAVEVERAGTGETVVMTASWLFGACGYYRYDEGFTPELPGVDRFRGRLVHPQHWPEDLDYAGKRVVVVGSGATAMTIVPAMAEETEHITMLQRSPSYVIPLPSKDRLSNWMRRKLGERRAYRITRRKNILLQAGIFKLSRRFPALVRRLIRAVNERELRDSGVDVDVHFKPAYDPWDQRLCVVPDGDLYGALRSGRAAVVTDRIATFTETGIRLESGGELEADVVVTATGLNLLAFGGLELVVDGEAVSLPDTVAYKAMMLGGVPNFAYAIGYTNASWTLKVDLVCEYLCRLLGHLDATGNDTAVPVIADPGMRTRPLLDFKAGYVLRALDRFPRQGERAPWRVVMSYADDVKTLRGVPVDDGVMRFSRSARRDRRRVLDGVERAA